MPSIRRYGEQRRLTSLAPFGKILGRARHLGGRYAFNGSNKAELECRRQGLRGFWFARSPLSHRRLIFQSRIVSASITDLDELVDTTICSCFRAPSKGKADDHVATESDGRSWTNVQLFHKWKVLSARAEIAIRRVKLWQAMTEHNHAHLQTMAAIWAQLPDGPQTLTSEGVLVYTTNPVAVASSEGLHLFAGLSGTEDFFELWEAKTILCGVHFRRRRRQRLLPAHRLQTHANSSFLQSNTLEHTDGKDHTVGRKQRDVSAKCWETTDDAD